MRGGKNVYYEYSKKPFIYTLIPQASWTWPGGVDHIVQVEQIQNFKDKQKIMLIKWNLYNLKLNSPDTAL